MKTYIFKDIMTGEQFRITCKPFEVHYIELKNKDFAEWSKNRIIYKIEIN